MAKHGKAYLHAKQQFDRAREYAPDEAIALVKGLRGAKFNQSSLDKPLGLGGKPTQLFFSVGKAGHFATREGPLSGDLIGGGKQRCGSVTEHAYRGVRPDGIHNQLA